MNVRPAEYLIEDDLFRTLILGPHVAVEQLWSSGRWVEGPVWFGDARHLLWSDIPNDRMMRWTESGGVSVFRQPSNHANGHTRDMQGRLISCEHGARRVTRTEWDGSITVLADRYDGKRLNSPNDVVVAADGAVWFTDPDYGILTDYEGQAGAREQTGCFLFRLYPDSRDLTIMADDFAKPNGLTFSQDGSRLYVSDTGRSHDPDAPGHIRIFHVGEGGQLSGGDIFAAPAMGLSDGMCCDVHGNIWTSAGGGVHCFGPDGVLFGSILVPEQVSNCTFGGPRRNRLFITATSSLYAVFLNTRGAEPH